jgi:hypothetical protein
VGFTGGVLLVLGRRFGERGRFGGRLGGRLMWVVQLECCLNGQLVGFEVLYFGMQKNTCVWLIS